MFCSTRRVLAIVALIGTAALNPGTAAAFAVGHDRIAGFGGGSAAFTPRARASTVLYAARLRCHSVQMGDPRKQPPMLVCP
jgi:hypothetical protein